jgi:hypothetical protein
MSLASQSPNLLPARRDTRLRPPSPIFDPRESAFANRPSRSEATPVAPPAPAFVSAPDTRVPFSRKRNPFCAAPLSF